ncbi:MAG: reverse transcriptase domain-containing protein [Roseiarcus sp.]|jgi:retron-type reverse transcriptase
MTPNQQNRRGRIDLARQARLLPVLNHAWQSVEARARGSKDKQAQTALARIKENPARALKEIAYQLKAGTFVFEAQRGVLKKRRGGKKSRPIVVAPIVNRIVQRAILDVCQSETRSLRRELGRLPDVVDCPTSVGGLPRRGVPEAIALIMRSMDEGAKWFVRSDLKDFFTHIPKPLIRTFLLDNIADVAFVDLFMAALETELSNPEAVREWIDLFPLGDEGVPQGSALSALCANIVLHEFDKQLNGRGVTTVRYLDDFVILAPTKKAADKTWKRAATILKLLGLEAHDPALNTGKAAQGEIKDGFAFLSFQIGHRQFAPSREAKTKFLDDLQKTIREAKKQIVQLGVPARRAEPAFVQSLALVDRKVRGWGDAFRSTTQRNEFDQLDREIDRLIDGYLRWFREKTRSAAPRERRRKMGIAVLLDTQHPNPKDPSGVAV